MGTLQTKKEYHDFINKCEVAMSKSPAEFPLVHKFAPGIYRREMFIPQGGFLSSMVHKYENFFEVVSGTINILTEDGVTQFIAPADGISKKGSRKLGFALTDVIFVTYHPNPNNCKDIPTLEAKLFKEYKNPLLKLSK